MLLHYDVGKECFSVMYDTRSVFEWLIKHKAKCFKVYAMGDLVLLSVKIDVAPAVCFKSPVYTMR